MSLALQYIWILPVAIGVAGVFYFGMKDLGPNARTAISQAKTED